MFGYVCSSLNWWLMMFSWLLAHFSLSWWKHDNEIWFEWDKLVLFWMDLMRGGMDVYGEGNALFSLVCKCEWRKGVELLSFEPSQNSLQNSGSSRLTEPGCQLTELQYGDLSVTIPERDIFWRSWTVGQPFSWLNCTSATYRFQFQIASFLVILCCRSLCRSTLG